MWDLIVSVPDHCLFFTSQIIWTGIKSQSASNSGQIGILILELLAHLY